MISPFVYCFNQDSKAKVLSSIPCSCFSLEDILIESQRLERQGMESESHHWENILLVAGIPSFGPFWCGCGCSLVIWRMNGFGGLCLCRLSQK